MKTCCTSVAPVKSFARNGLRLLDIVGLIRLPIIGVLALVGGVMFGITGLAVLGAGCVGIFLAGGTSIVLQLHVLSPPAPTLSVIDGRPATVLRREPVAFTLGLVVMAIMGATVLG